MAPDKAVPVRFSDKILERADLVAVKLAARAAGAKVTRSEVIRLALERGLTAIEADILSQNALAASEFLKPLAKGMPMNASDAAEHLAKHWRRPVDKAEAIELLEASGWIPVGRPDRFKPPK